MVSSGFSWFFKVPICFFFYGFMSVLIVFHGSRLVFHGSKWVSIAFNGFRWATIVFHGSRLVFIVPGRFLQFQIGFPWFQVDFFMAPSTFSWLFKVLGWFFMISGGILW